MLTLGHAFPDFRLRGVVANELDDAFIDVSSNDLQGAWSVFVFYPKDFTFVCPTELAGFGRLEADFRERDTRLFGVSTDSEFVHLAWRRSEESLNELPYPLLSDIRRDLSEALGVLDPDEKVCMRATYIIDPDGIVRFAAVQDGSVGRNPDEILRVLDALQTGELCPCNWNRGEETIQVA
ncbi:MAG: peroxiredoxin [Planctomycetota bacterium]